MKYFTLIILIGASFRLSAQNDSSAQTFIDKKCKIVYCTLDDKIDRSPVFKHIEVIDFRPDTSRIGIVRIPGVNQQLRLHSTAKDVLSAYLNTAYASPAAPDSFRLVVRKLWSYDSLLNESNRQKLDESYLFKAMLAFRGEVFAKVDGGWLPVTYLDTVVEVSGGGSHLIYHQIPSILSRIAQKISQADITDLKVRKRTITESELTDHYKSRFAHPIYSATTLKKGVYMSAQEFRDNQPSIPQYEMRTNTDGYQDIYIPDDHCR